MPSVRHNTPALPLPVTPTGEAPAPVDDLVPLAAELVATVRDYGPDEVAAILARVPRGRHDLLAVVLAAMVDPDARPSQLLAWASHGPVPSRDYTPSAFRSLVVDAAGQQKSRRAEIARLTAAGWGPTAIAEQLGITKRAVCRHRTILRAQAEQSDEAA